MLPESLLELGNVKGTHKTFVRETRERKRKLDGAQRFFSGLLCAPQREPDAVRKEP
jgi:hypothetical protein